MALGGRLRTPTAWPIGSLEMKFARTVALAILIVGAAGSAAAAPPTAFLTPQERREKNSAYLASAPNPDEDGDGRLSFPEWLSKEWRFLLSWDADGDQRLSMAEYIAAFCILEPDGSRSSAYNACEKTKRTDFPRAAKQPDFKITRELYRPIARRSFGYNDRDGDGYLVQTSEWLERGGRVR